MKKIYVQIVDTLTGISQTGMIEEPVLDISKVETK